MGGKLAQSGRFIRTNFNPSPCHHGDDKKQKQQALATYECL